ncbi:MAG: hypothetical protein K0S04_134 [Herbinix sp.]|nr:hypothetical protein [Herbinix sp.]
MSNQNKVVKFKKRRGINIGIIVFLILFLYVAINVYIYLTKDQLSIYEVHEGTTAVDNKITGIILREEKLVYSKSAGYISYFQREGTKVAKDSSIYSVDENGQIYNVLESNDVKVKITDRDNAEIRHDIRAFQDKYSDSNFSTVYNFKENSQSTALDLLNNTVINEGTTLKDNTGSALALNMVSSSESGIISYYTDSYESVTPESVSEDSFHTESYKRTNLRTTEMMTKDSPVYKLITSDTWKVVLPLTKSQYDSISESKRIKFTILEDEFKMSADLSFITKDSIYYAVLTMDKYMTNYLEERFLEVELDFNSVEGLKIPVTALVEKDFYLIPKDYFCYGADSQDRGVIKKLYSKTGDISYPFVKADTYYVDGSNEYVDTSLFEAGTVLQLPEASGEYTLSKTSQLLGVYNVNQGYAVFKRVEILYQDEEYCIISDDTTNGLSAYDQIALDGSNAIDQAIIY